MRLFGEGFWTPVAESRYKKAKRFLRRYAMLSLAIDRFMTAGSKPLGWCSEAKNKRHWSILFSDLFFTECPCCLFFRGVTVGAVSTIIAFSIGAAIWMVIGA